MSERFRSLCPACSNRDLITWHHKGCPDGYKEYIDIEGYITCECNKRFHILDADYNCGSGVHNNKYDPVTSRARLRKIFCMCAKIDTTDDDWVDRLEDNILKEWDRRH